MSGNVELVSCPELKHLGFTPISFKRPTFLFFCIHPSIFHSIN